MKKKYLVYRLPDGTDPAAAPYQLTKVFDDEYYEVLQDEHFERGGVKAIIPKPHIIIKKIIGGTAVNTVYGEFVSEHEDEREARIAMGHMNDIHQIMES
jgi:hypothetical protein